MYLEYIDKEKMIKSIREACAIKSVVTEAVPGMPFGEGSARALKYALDLAKSMGYRTVNLDNKVGYAEYGEGDEMIAVLGHVDVVPEGEGWMCDPYEGTVKDGRIYARGVADDKGPIIGALYALDAVVKSGKPLKRRVRIIFGADEEVGCTDMVRYKETEEIPTMAFTPDAEYPAVFCEKGILHYTLTKKVHGVIKAHGGLVVNQVPDYAEIEFDSKGQTYRTEGKGLTAHGSRPFLGRNAIDNLVENLHNTGNYEHLEGDLKEFFDFYEKYFKGDCYGVKLGIDREEEEFGRTTTNVGVLEYRETAPLEGELILSVDNRLNPDEDGDETMAHVAQIAKEYGFEYGIILNRKALLVPKDSILIRTLMKVLKENTGIECEPLCMGGGTYAKALPNTVAFGPLFPGKEDPIHQPNEYVEIEDLLKNGEIMAQAIYELANI